MCRRLSSGDGFRLACLQSRPGQDSSYTETDPERCRRGPQVPHGTLTRWLEGCDCDQCREAQNDAARARFRRKAQERLPAGVRQQLLDAIYGGRAFRTALRELGLTSNQVWGLAKTDREWSKKLE